MDDFVWSVKRTLRACLQGERVTLASGLKLALVYKQISLAGLHYHPAQRNQLYIVQAPVVQTLDSAIHRIKICLVDNAIGFPNTYPLDSDLSGG